MKRDILAEYSNILRKMHGIETRKPTGDRSPESVEIKVRYFASIDPYQLKLGKKGFKTAPKAVQKLWDELHQKPDIVAKMAQDIKLSILANGEVAPHDSHDSPESPESFKISAAEGNKKLVTHHKIERDRTLRRKK